MSKVSRLLYNASRNMNKAASTCNDIETILTGDPKKIIKRIKRKKVGKALNKMNRGIMKKI